MKLQKLDIADFNSFYSEIQKSFIEDERRDYKDARKLFCDGKYEILSLIYKQKRVGFISLWQLSDFTFAEHFVIHEEYRNLGLGAKALAELQRIYKKIVLEAEPPTEDVAKRRLGFYKRNGFVENEGDYFQPAYRKEGNEVRLVIMSYPDKVKSFGDAVSDIKRTVYANLKLN